jgi:predicted GIY-YIG superfamily endonuclease
MADVYCLHFLWPYWGKAQHYTGRTKFTAEERIEVHRSGKGSKLVAYALAHGNDFILAYKESFDTQHEAMIREHRLKKRHGGVKGTCPICNKLKKGKQQTCSG